MAIIKSEEKKYPSFNDLDEWMKYHAQVTASHPNFFTNLSIVHPYLTDHQIKLCSLFLFECEIPEIAGRMGKISVEAVTTAKYRLRKKFKLKEGEHLAPYLQRVAAGLILPPPPPVAKSIAARALH